MGCMISAQLIRNTLLSFWWKICNSRLSAVNSDWLSNCLHRYHLVLSGMHVQVIVHPCVHWYAAGDKDHWPTSIDFSPAGDIVACDNLGWLRMFDPQGLQTAQTRLFKWDAEQTFSVASWTHAWDVDTPVKRGNLQILNAAIVGIGENTLLYHRMYQCNKCIFPNSTQVFLTLSTACNCCMQVPCIHSLTWYDVISCSFAEWTVMCLKTTHRKTWTRHLVTLVLCTYAACWKMEERSALPVFAFAAKRSEIIMMCSCMCGCRCKVQQLQLHPFNPHVMITAVMPARFAFCSRTYLWCMLQNKRFDPASICCHSVWYMTWYFAFCVCATVFWA